MDDISRSSVMVFSICDFGAVADGVTDDAGAIQRAVDACHDAGGGRVIIPEGARILAGSFLLRSRVEFHVAAGAVLRCATTIDALPERVFAFGEEADKRFWIGARHGEDILLSGEGTIDGQCHAFALGENEEIFSPTVRWRPAMTCFEDIRRLTVRDLTFRNAANWTLHFTGCQDVDVHDVKIFNDLKFPNADGIDPDHCRRVRITRCHIVAADDCIVLKNTAPFASYGDCEDIEVSFCRLESVSAAFKIGSESHNAFRRVRVTDCVIERSHRGLAIQLRDSGDVEDIAFRDIQIETRRFAPVWWGAGEAIYITALPRNPSTQVGAIRNVRFHNIRCTGENGVVVYGDPGDRIRDLDFENVDVAIARHTRWPSGLFDLRPCSGGYLPAGAEPAAEDTPWGRPTLRTPAGFSIEGAEGVRFSNVACSVPDGDGWVLQRGGGPRLEK